MESKREYRGRVLRPAIKRYVQHAIKRIREKKPGMTWENINDALGLSQGVAQAYLRNGDRGRTPPAALLQKFAGSVALLLDEPEPILNIEVKSTWIRQPGDFFERELSVPPYTTVSFRGPDLTIGRPMGFKQGFKGFRGARKKLISDDLMITEMYIICECAENDLCEKCREDYKVV